MIDLSLFAYQFYIPEGTLVYHENVKRMFQENILENVYKVENLGLSGEKQIGEYHLKMAECQRADIKHKARFNIENVKLENCCLFSSPEIPILFIDHYKIEQVESPTHNENNSSFSEIIDEVEKITQVKPRKRTSIEEFSNDSGDKSGNTPEDSTLRQSIVIGTDHKESTQGMVIGATEFENLYTSVEDFEEFADGKHIIVPPSIVINPMTISKNDLCEVNIHLLFLVHGYQGSSFDLTFFKDCLMFLAEENLKIICSTVNDSDSSRCIDELGLNLANEIKEIVKIYDNTNSLKK